MDREQFDALAQHLATRRRRRTALAIGLSAFLLRGESLLVSARRNGNGNGRHKKKRRSQRKQNLGSQDQCSIKPGKACSILDPNPCGNCPGMLCLPSAGNPLITNCEAMCGSTGSIPTCADRFGKEWACVSDPVACLYLATACCQIG